jgi:membrane peptidoglycan carboxypeptidase
LFLSLIAILVGVLSVIFYIELVQGLPSMETLPALLNPPNGLLLQPTRIYDRSGTHVLLTLQNPAVANRTFLSVNHEEVNFLPAPLISATLAVADPTFWTQPGYSSEGLLSGKHATLAQTLVSDFLLPDEPQGLRRALRERLLAAQVTARYGRQQVLVWFLNSTNYGRLIYGADAAARVYLGKPASQLTLAESALLAAVMQSPALNPFDAPKVAEERAAEVLQAMQASGWITPDQADRARKETFKFQSQVSPAPNPAPAFLQVALQQLGREFSLNRLERGGYRVITSLDLDLQQQAACTLQTQIERLAGNPTQATTPDADSCPAARLLPTSFSEETAGRPQAVDGNLVILDHQSGQVLALVGSASSGSNPAQYSGHPPGSLLTPFIYLTGFTRGMSPATLLWDIPTGSLESLNLDGKFHGPLRLRTALINDDIAPALSVLNQTGDENVWHMARQLGLESASLPGGTTAQALLGEGDVTLLEVSRAYGTFANQGILTGRETHVPSSSTPAPTEAITYLRLEDVAGKTWLDTRDAVARPVISPQLAFLVTNILSDEPARWPVMGHPNPLEIGRPLAAKLGRTATGKDAWAIASTPFLTTGIWLGSSAQVTTQDAAAVLHAIAQYANRNLPPDGWPTPLGISTISVCDPSGMLPTSDCPAVVSEVFLAGNEPTQTDTLYRKMQINRETGLLATVFTPPELIEDRVYLIVPPEAQEWARQAGLQTPPETFDVIQANSSSSPYTHITFPTMFAYVRGIIPVQGSAGGDQFERFRLQIGQGLNPQRWLQVGQDGVSPVIDGELGAWDTQGLNGLYAIQLLVIDQGQRVQTDVIQVTVDNQPPTVKIISPAPEEQIDGSTRDILLQAEVTDDLAIKSAEFIVDGQRINTLTQSPYTLTWPGRSGDHTLLVRATDQAGNTDQAEVTFHIH